MNEIAETMRPDDRRRLGLGSGAGVQLQPDKQPQAVFAGAGRSILSRSGENDGDKIVTMDMYARISQASAATTMFLNENELEGASGPAWPDGGRIGPNWIFPMVRAGTKFLVQWFENTNTVLGHTEVMVYPTNLLAELKPLAGDKPVGLLDPQNVLKPWLKDLGVDFTDLQDSNLENFPGQLVIIGPFAAKSQMRAGLTDEVRQLARKGAGIVWFQPPADQPEKLTPSFYTVPFKTNAVVIVQADLAGDLAANPQAQLHLISFCRLALKPMPSRLPQPSLTSLSN